MFAWNVESDGSDPNTMANQLSRLKGHHIYGLSEVDKNAVELYQEALGKSIQGTNQHSDLLQLLYDSKRLELLSWSEIHEYGETKLNTSSRDYRSPLLARFKHKKRKLEFQVVLNHLARSKKEFRKQRVGRAIFQTPKTPATIGPLFWKQDR